MQDRWRLEDYQKLFEAELARAFAENGDREIDVERITKDVLNEILPETANALYDELAKRSNRMLREHRSLRRGFVRRNRRRWREAFDLFERLIVISQETGEAINFALRPDAVKRNDAVFEATISNHARAVQVSREILALMTAGFPDGALARWRTLHEIAVVSSFISHHGDEVATRYILHRRVVAHKNALNYMAHHQRANLNPIDTEKLVELREEYDWIIAKYGDEMNRDYGWAASSLGNLRPNFADIEAATKLDHWRPRYKWATTNTHGGYQPTNSTLGTSESDRPVLLVGESNSGMTDPGHMAAISLVVATMPVVMLEPNVDRLVAAQIMNRLTTEIGETFWRLDRESLARHRMQSKNLFGRIRAILNLEKISRH